MSHQLIGQFNIARHVVAEEHVVRCGVPFAALVAMDLFNTKQQQVGRIRGENHDDDDDDDDDDA